VDKFSEFFARLISYILHPVFMPTIGMIVIYFVGNVPGFNSYSIESDKDTALLAITILFIATGIIPLLIAIILKQQKVISSLQMPHKEERTIPFILTCLCYFSAYYLLKYHLELNLNGLIFYFIFFGMFATILGFFITLSWKISIHMIGVGGIAGILTLLSKTSEDILLYPLIITFFCAGLIAFSRLQLNAHNSRQIIVGFCLGFGCEILGLFYLIDY
jgi:membrane-associated phospholipid phosphatase